MPTKAPPTQRHAERRYLQGLELREIEKPEDGHIATLEGYAAVFDSLSEDLGYFYEQIRAGAFKESLDRGDDVRALVGHDARLIIGRRSAKTLEISEDEKGLKVKMFIPDTAAGRDLVVSVKRGDLTGMSFGFFVVDDEWTRQTRDGKTIYLRELITVEVFEVSVVTWPAYTSTSVEARGAKGEIDLRAEREARSKGYAQLFKLGSSEVRSLESIFDDAKQKMGKDPVGGAGTEAPPASRSKRLFELHRRRMEVLDACD